MKKSEKNKDGVSMKIAMDQYLKAMGIDRKIIETEILSNWRKIMGDAVEERTEAKSIKNGILYLKINSSVMRNELFQMRSVIIKRVNEAAGFELISDVFFD